MLFRSFTLWDRLTSIQRAIRVRGGLRHRRSHGLPWVANGSPLLRLPQVGGIILGMAVIRAIDLSGTYDDALRLRGYRGLMHPTRRDGARRFPAAFILWGGCVATVGMATAVRVTAWNLAG